MSLDVSTTTIGIAIIQYDDGYIPGLIHYEWYRPNYTKSSWNDLDTIKQLTLIKETQEKINKLARKYKIDEFAIEDYVKFLSKGSSAQTIIPLAVLNMSIRMDIWSKLKIKPVALNVMKIRHAIKLTKKLPKKEEIPDLISKILANKNLTVNKMFAQNKNKIEWTYKINRRTKKQELTKEMYDVADAIAVGLAYIKLKAKEI